MKKAYAAILTLLLATAVMAAGPYTVRYADDPADVMSSAPLAVVSTSPFDAASGLLSDGVDHYFLVTDSAGSPVTIAINKNPGLDTVRISFDDNNPQSAPVNPALSTVTVAPATIDADGVSQATVTIIPRDAQGVPLGNGLNLELDIASLWPGRVTSIVRDQANGSYVVSVVSAFPGNAFVLATVEGIALTDMPAIEYVEVLEPGSLLEWAIQLLQDVTENGGDFDQVLSNLSGSQAREVDAALNHTLDALTLLLNPDASGHDEAVSRNLKRAVSDLIHILDSLDGEISGEVTALVNSLLEAGRNAALYYILESGMACGTCLDTGSTDLCNAESSLAQGDAAWQETPPNYMLAVTKYGLAASQAIRSGEECY